MYTQHVKSSYWGPCHDLCNIYYGLEEAKYISGRADSVVNIKLELWEEHLSHSAWPRMLTPAGLRRHRVVPQHSLSLLKQTTVACVQDSRIEVNMLLKNDFNKYV